MPVHSQLYQEPSTVDLSSLDKDSFDEIVNFREQRRCENLTKSVDVGVGLPQINKRCDTRPIEYHPSEE